MNRRKAILSLMIAALFVPGAAICALGQQRNDAVKQNKRGLEARQTTDPVINDAPTDDVIYSYEFQKSDFHVRHILIKHDSMGRGEISFEKQGDLEPITEPIALSESARTRILNHWNALRFLDSSENYQAAKQFPHLGTMRLKMKRGTHERTAEFNWTDEPNAKALVDEYRRAANQAVFIFDMWVARQNQPLDSPKLLNRLDSHLKRNDLSDPQQLVPLLSDLSTDERLPLITRNHAARILKKLEKK
jgi:hypothetical protein